MIPGKRYTPDDVVRAAWRRRWWIAVPAVVATITAVYLSLKAAPKFRSEALIQVVTPAVASSVVGTVEGQTRYEERLLSISRQIMTRPRLQKIVEDFNLYEQMRKATVMENVIEQMRSDTMFDIVDREIFLIGYVAGSPQLAFDVAQRVTALFLEESSRDREGQAEATQDFLQAQLEDAKRRLEGQEKKLEEYQVQYAGELPSQQAANLQVLGSSELQLQNLTETVHRDRDQRLFLQRQVERIMTEEGPLAGGAGSALGLPGADPSSAAQQLEKARADLREMELRLTPEHPDILQAKANVAKLEKKAEAEARTTAARMGGARTPAEALKQSRVRDLLAHIEVLDRQLATKQAEEGRVRSAMAEYRRRIEVVPMRDAELTALTRDYETLKKMYTDLLANKEKAKLAANLQRQEIGERFRVLERARVPEKRFSPNRTHMCLIGMGIGLVLGLALAALVEFRDSSLRTDDDVEASLGLPVLAMVPVVGAIDEQDRLLRLAVVLILGAALMSFAAGFAWSVTSGHAAF